MTPQGPNHRTLALPTLKSYSLLMAAIGLMHRMSRPDFEEARKLLQALIDRATRQSLAQAWLAHWYVLRVQQGWSSDQTRDSQIALESSKRALDADPDCSLALAIDGAVHTNLLKRLDVAEERYERALQANPNNALAWLLNAVLSANLSGIYDRYESRLLWLFGVWALAWLRLPELAWRRRERSAVSGT